MHINNIFTYQLYICIYAGPIKARMQTDNQSSRAKNTVHVRAMFGAETFSRRRYYQYFFVVFSTVQIL